MGRPRSGGAWGRRALLAATTLACLLVSATGRAERLSPDQVPAELRDWIPWVLDEVGDEACTLVEGERVCAWLGRLGIEVSPTGGRFRLELLTERATRVPLPGSTKHWPSGVKVGAEAGVVLDVSGVPWIRLPAGRHTVEGRFSWRKLPELLPVPSSVARVTVKSDDRVVTAPRREANGAVWLGGSTSEEDSSAAEPERLEIEVMRRIEDGVPLVVTTKVKLRVGGRPREVRLEQPLLEGGVLLELESKTLAAHFEQDGVLVLEAKKGKHVVRIRERHGGSVEALKLAKRAEPWPADEVWAWRPAVALRQVEVAGGSPIDPSRTNLPDRWRKLQAFKLRAPTQFELKTLRRGNPEPPPNRIGMRRSIRMDLDGEGFTVVDHLQGTMHRDWRLSFVGKGELGQVSKAGMPVRDHLITNEPGSNRPGVELRDGQVSLFAEWRGEGTPSRLAAVGWATDLDQLAVELRLPPGWELLGASGADDVWPSRLNGWDVLDLVWVLLIALAVGKLTRWHWAPVAALAMALCHESHYAPWWSWGGLLATVALLHYLPAGRPRRLARVAWWGAAAVVVFGLLSFAVLEVRDLVYPHAISDALAERELEEKETEQIAEEHADNREGGTGTRARGEEGSMGAPSRVLSDASEFGMIGLLNAGAGGDPDAPTAPWGRDDSLGTDGNKDITPPRKPQQDPKAVIQTGHGVPRWTFTSATLKWVGPVEQGHQIRLWLLSPTLRAALTILALALAGWLAVLLLRRSRPTGQPGASKPPAAKAAVAAVVAGAVVLGVTVPAQAAAPPKELLDELKTRLTRPPECSPDCVTVDSMTARARGNTLELSVKVHVGATASYQLPGPADSWVPATIEVDGKPSRELVSLKGHLYLRLKPGTHEVKLSGPIAGDELTLSLGTPPHAVRAEVDGWEVDGVDEDSHADSSIHFRRTTPTEPGDAPADETPAPETAPKTLSVPPWLEVRRTLEVNVSWTISTRLRRISAPGAPIVVRIPLLPGEKVLDGGFPQEGQALVVTLGRDDREATFRSALTPADTLELKAAVEQPWTEVWRLDCGEVWRCAPEGLAPVRHESGGSWQPTFRPWPGESLKLTFQRPPPAPGRTLTITGASLALRPKERAGEASLKLTVHSSTGGVFPFTIPTGVRITRLAVDDKAQPAEGTGGEVKVALKPGRQQVEVKWQQPGGIGMFYRAPIIKLGDQLANGRVTIELPPDRWLIFMGGSKWGPQVQLWAYLVLLVALGFALGKVPGSPLKGWQWALLGAGLTQPPYGFAIAIAGWFFVITYRKHWSLGRRAHNSAQVGVALWTLAAVGALAMVAYDGVADTPWMMVADARTSFMGGHYYGSSWYVDHSTGTLPRPWVLSGSVWIWRLAMAAWSAWVVLLLIPWARTAWANFNEGGIWLRAAPAVGPTEELAGDDATPEGTEAAGDEAAASESAEQSDESEDGPTDEDEPDDPDDEPDRE